VSPSKVSATVRCLVMKVTLRHVRPPVWRRFTMRDDASFQDLHEVLQTVMGWEDSHMHEFRAAERTIGIPTFEPTGSPEDEDGVRLREVFRKAGDRAVYAYDFGDRWEHAVEVEEVRRHEPRSHYPVILDGRRACPPEDCGGPVGFAGLLAALRSPENPHHQTAREWTGPEFEPERFDKHELNRRFHGGWQLPEQAELALPARRVDRMRTTGGSRAAPKTKPGVRGTRVPGTALQPGEDMAWISDARDFAGADNGKGRAPGAKGMAQHIRAIIEAFTATADGVPRLIAVQCRRRPARMRCVGLLGVNLDTRDGPIRWECVACGDHGEISHWQDSIWDLGGRPKRIGLLP
jgi:hypothetical protein